MSECIRVATATNLNEMRHLNALIEPSDVEKSALNGDDLFLANSKTSEKESNHNEFNQKETVMKSVLLNEENTPPTNPKVKAKNQKLYFEFYLFIFK